MFRELLLQRVKGFCSLSPAQVEQLHQHYELMLRWNKVINLTRIEDVQEAVDRHYAESLFLGASLPTGSLRIADVGSGAGFPGVPIAILRPECLVTLIESHQRKSVFLKEAARSLPNVSVEGKRAEDVSTRFDWVVSRAVNWTDLEKTVVRLAPSVGLLGNVGPKTAKMVPLPWAEERKILMFHVKQESSRST